jgi:integrase
MRRWRAAGQRYVVEWNGEPVQRVTKAHNAAVKAAGLGSDVTPHIWRHSLATWLMQNGAEPFKAAGFLGMSVETLLRNYGHHHPDHSADVHSAMRRKAA